MAYSTLQEPTPREVVVRDPDTGRTGRGRTRGRAVADLAAQTIAAEGEQP